MSENIMTYETVDLSDDDEGVIIIDQTRLPGKVEMIRLRTAQEIWDAIYLLKVRGAPAIGVAAAFGIYVLARQIAEEAEGISGLGASYGSQSDVGVKPDGQGLPEGA